MQRRISGRLVFTLSTQKIESQGPSVRFPLEDEPITVFYNLANSGSEILFS